MSGGVPVKFETFRLSLTTYNFNDIYINLTFVCPCIASIIVNDDQQAATILAYLFIPNQLYMFSARSLPIIRST